MGRAALEERLKRFTGLTAAQRALSRSIHPAELAPLHEQSRTLLIELRDLVRSAEGSTTPESVIEHIDRALVEQSERTRSFIDQIDMRQLRATIPMIAHQHPDEVGGLVDLLLEGGFSSDKELRTIEYLITLLSAEEVAGRRNLRRSPAEITERLKVACERQRADADSDWIVAERMLDEATAKVMQGGDVGEIRDRVRRCKEEFGADLLHPSVLTASVKYNIAMWNHVAAEIDSSRSIEELAADLLADPSGMPVPVPGSTGATMLDSHDFAQLLETFSARVRGEMPESGRFDRFIDRLDLDSIPPARIEDFADTEPDAVSWHVRAAILMGLVLDGLPSSADALTVAGLDPEAFLTEGYDDLIGRMTELGRKHFASSDDTQAFRLSDVKTHHLTVHRAARNRAAGGDERPKRGGRGGKAAESETPALWRAFTAALPSGVVLVGLLAIVPLIYMFSTPAIVGDDNLGEGSIGKISPFLASAHVQNDAGDRHYVARVEDTWSYLGDAERRKMGNRIGTGFEALGADRVTLVDTRGLIVMRYDTGAITMLAPRIEVGDD